MMVDKMSELFEEDYSLAELLHLNSKISRQLSPAPVSKDILSAGTDNRGIKHYSMARQIDLPSPEASRQVDMFQLMRKRYSNRQWIDHPISLKELSTLLKWSAGITRSHTDETGKTSSFRAVPSGGGLYPVEVYPIALRVESLQPSVTHYNPLTHRLACLQTDASLETYLLNIVTHPEFFANVSVVFILTAVFRRSMYKYKNRGYRFIHLEAGHMAQNLCLIAQSLGLGSLCAGGFYDYDVEDLLWIDGRRESPLYLIAVGHAHSGEESV